MNKPEKSSKAPLVICGLPVEEFLFWCNDPTARELISHYKQKAKDAKASGDSRSEWNFMTAHANQALEALEKGKIDIACREFFHLGEVSDSINRIPQEDTEYAFELMEAHRIRTAPLRSKVIFAKYLKHTAQKLAQENWQSDTDQQIRISEMADIVWGKLYERITTEFSESTRESALEALPDLPVGLRPWLRELAPDYAKKPGRPRKK
jgi:hypothetical protein